MKDRALLLSWGLIRIAGSFLRNAKAGQITQSGSTITQQLIEVNQYSLKKIANPITSKFKIMLTLPIGRVTLGTVPYYLKQSVYGK